MSVKPIVYLVDGDAEGRESLATLIRLHRFASVRCYDRAATFMAAYKTAVEGCVILNVCLPDGSGLNLFNGQFRRRIEHPVILLATRVDAGTAVQAMRDGAIDVFEKPCRAEVLISRINEAFELYRRNVDRNDRRRRLSLILGELTEEERQVMKAIEEGTPNKVAASRMGISLRTFHARRASLMRKCDVDSRAAVVQLAALNTSPAFPRDYAI